MVFERKIYSKLLTSAKDEKISLIFGPRQSGKTFLLKLLEQEISKNNKLKTKYFNLEFPDHSIEFNKSELEIFNMFKQYDYIFLDEFHYVENISKIFKAIYDWCDLHPKENIKIFASGSSAIEMHKHLKESMVGRFEKFYVRPLSYQEFLSNKSIKPTLSDYLSYGGLPGVYHKNYLRDKMKREFYLKNVFENYIQKDIKSLIHEENISAFNHLCFILAANQGQITPSSNLAREVQLSAPSIERYLDILQETFILHEVKSFAKNLSNEMKKSKKYYFYDLGVRNEIAEEYEITQENKGQNWESFTCLHLRLLMDTINAKVYFWRTNDNLEIDFIWLRNRKPTPIEVISTLKKPEVPKAFKTFFKAYPNAPMGIVMNSSIDEVVSFMDRPVHFIKFEDIEYLEELFSPEEGLE